jgi:hypothetical protein
VASLRTLVLFVVCTDRGQHARSRLGQLHINDPPTGRRVGAGNLLGQGRARSVPEYAGGVTWTEYGVEVRCDRCRRHVEWRHETALNVIVAMCAGERDAWLDISHLP